MAAHSAMTIFAEYFTVSPCFDFRNHPIGVAALSMKVVVPANAGTHNHRRHPEEPRTCAASRRIAAGTGACGHPSRLAVKDGEHLRMTAVFWLGTTALTSPCRA